MHIQSYELEGLAQANSVLTSSKYTVMIQLAQMIMTINAMRAQPKNTRLCTNRPSKAKKEALLLDLREQFHPREQQLLKKESGTSGVSVLQENDRWQ